MTTLESTGRNALDVTLRSLATRIVTPRARLVARATNPVTDLTERLDALIRNKVVFKNYKFARSGTGIQRTVDFYANSTTNTALEALQFDLRTTPTTIITRADAEANKLNDIKLENPDVEFIVYCRFSEQESFQEANSKALKIIEAANADVETDAAAAAGRFTSSLKR